METYLSRGAIKPGLKILARFFANRTRIFGPAKRARKSEKISCNRDGISARAALGSRSDFSGVKAIKDGILFIVSLISKFEFRQSMRTSTSLQIRLNSTTLSRKPWTRQAWKYRSSLSLQIRLSSDEICSQRQVSLQIHHLVGCYHPEKLNIELHQKTKLRQKQCAIFTIRVLGAILIFLRLFTRNFIFGAEANKPGWSPSWNRNKISARLAGLKFQPGLKFAMWSGPQLRSSVFWLKQIVLDWIVSSRC